MRVGFTAQGLMSLGEIWQFIPRVAVGEKVVFNQAIATIESTTALKSLLIPLDGLLIYINPEILTAPELVSDKTEVFGFSQVRTLNVAL